MGTSMMSRVVPGVAVTMAASRRARALRIVLLPALGAPIRAILKPSLTRSPRRRPLARAAARRREHGEGRDRALPRAGLGLAERAAQLVKGLAALRIRL